MVAFAPHHTEVRTVRKDARRFNLKSQGAQESNTGADFQIFWHKRLSELPTLNVQLHHSRFRVMQNETVSAMGIFGDTGQHTGIFLQYFPRPIQNEQMH